MASPIDAYYERISKRDALAARMARFQDERETNAIAAVKEEAFLGLLASALVEAEESCDCDVVSAFLTTEDGCVSICSPRSPAPERPSLIASALSSGHPVEEYLADRGVLLTDFRLINSQRRQFTNAIVAAASPKE